MTELLRGIKAKVLGRSVPAKEPSAPPSDPELEWGEGFQPKWIQQIADPAEFASFEAAFSAYLDRRLDIYAAIPDTAGWPRFLPTREKVFEYFLTFKGLDLRPGSVYMDVASCLSLFPSFLAEQCGVDVIRQDMFYPKGLQPIWSRAPEARLPWSPQAKRMWMLGCDGAELPLPDRSLDAIALHCSFEHFEGDSDSAFVLEALRVLRPGGQLLILPFYCGKVFKEFVAEDQVSGCQFQRYYSPASFARRILSKMVTPNTFDMIQYPNHQDIDKAFYCSQAARFTRVC